MADRLRYGQVPHRLVVASGSFQREGRDAKSSKLPDGKVRNELTCVRWIDAVLIILNYVADIHRESGRKPHDELPRAVQ